MKPSHSKYRFYSYIPETEKQRVLKMLETKTVVEICRHTGISIHHATMIIDEKLKFKK